MPSTRTSTSTRSPGARSRCATPSPRRRRATSRAVGDIDPETQVTVTCGATEAMIAAMLGLLDPGDEVVIFEPYYENYGPDAILSGAVPRYVTLHEPDWSIDPDELRARVRARGRAAIVLNSPHNPTGKVFTPRRARADRLALHRVRRHRLHRRHLRAPRLRGRAHPARDARRDGRTDREHPLDVEDLLGHRLAHRLDDRLASAVARDPAGPRLPDRRRRRAAPAGGRHRPRFPDGYYARSRSPGIASAATSWSPRSERAGLPRPRTGRRILRHDRHPRPGRPGEDDVAFAHRLIARPRCRRRPGLLVLLAARARPDRSCASRSPRRSRRWKRPRSDWRRS